MHLLLALFLQAAPSASPGRDVVARGLDEFDRNVRQLEQFIETRFDADAATPRTGIAIESDEAAGSDGLHAITVTRVVVGGPADTAGVQPGDRVTAVGPRRITHETATVFQHIVDGAPGPITLTLLRGGRERVVTVNRSPLACLQRSSDRIDLPKWRARVADLRRLSGIVRAELDDQSITPAEMRHRAAKDHVVALFGLIGELSSAYADEMMTAANTECKLHAP